LELAVKPFSFSLERINWWKFVPFGLFLLALVLYAHSFKYELMSSWDDNRYIAENYLLRDFSLHGVANIFTQIYFAAYIPVTIFSYWIEFHFWGMNPVGYHIVNVLINAANCALIHIFLLRLLKNRNIALMSALLWTVHPLQVESVVWIAERKSLLAMLFTLLAFLAYMRSAEDKPPVWALPAAYILYLLSALSKPAVVGVPLLFMTYDYFWAHMNLRRVIIRAIVPLAIGGASAVAIVVAHKSGGGIKTYSGGSFGSSALLMLMVYWEYVISFIAPWTLNNFYPYAPTVLNDNPASIFLGMLLVVGAVYVAWKQPFGKPFSVFAVAWIVLFMLPVSNIIPIAIVRADRYMYFPSVVIFAAAGILIDRLWQAARSPRARQAIVAVVAAVVAVLAGFAFFRSLVWQNEGVLWLDHLKTYPQSQTGWLNLGVYYYNKQQYAQALPVFQQLVALSPADFKGNRFLGDIALAQNRPADAIPFYRRALATQPNDGGTWSLLGLAYLDIGAYDEAIAQYRQAIKLDPDLTSAHANLGESALRLGNYTLAAQALQVVVKRNPKDAVSADDLCFAFAQLNQTQDAITYCGQAARLQPYNGLYVGRLASLLLYAHQPDKALPLAQQAVNVAPDQTLSYRVLGEAYADLGQKDKAVAALQKALQIDPNNSRARQVLSRLTRGS
jgi:tetratricopeptide (TPR) repeat protein